MRTVADRYDGVTIDNTTLPDSEEVFTAELEELLTSIESRKLLWVKVPIEKSGFIPILTNRGFSFHHSDERELMLVKKLVENPIVPTAKNYTIGVGAVVFDQGNILVIKEKFARGYKLPGGHVDDNEKIKDALIREVFEETGVAIAFESIVNIGHFTRGQFGESNIYLVCRAKALTKEICIHDISEITDARWMSIETFLSMEETNNYNRAVVKAALAEKAGLADRDIALNLPGEVFF